MSSPFDGLLRAVGGFAEGAAGTGEKIMGEQQAQRDREATIEKQDALTLQREQTMAEFRQGMEQKSLGAQHQSRMKAGQDIEDTYRAGRTEKDKPQSRMDELKAKADIAERKGYFEHAKQFREQQDVSNKERKLDIDEQHNKIIEGRTSGLGSQHTPAEAQMVEFIATKVLGDTSQKGYQTAYGLVKQSKGKSIDEQRANLAAGLIKLQYLKPAEANRIATELFPSDGQIGYGNNTTTGQSDVVDYTKYIPKKP